MNVDLQMTVGRFLIKTLSTPEELRQAYLLRHEVFQVEMVGRELDGGIDHDEFDDFSDHLSIFDTKTNSLVATCRLICSKFSTRFYSAQEFLCSSLTERPETKVEIGRVCVHKDYRRGIIIMLLWRALAEYMTKTESEILFGCGSVMTLDPNDTLVLYKYLREQGKVSSTYDIAPTANYRSPDFEKLLSSTLAQEKLSAEDVAYAETLLPPLCKSYFDIGCFISGPPAFDRDFKCIDFLTILEMKNLTAKIRKKVLGI